MELKQYDPAEVQLLVAGNVIKGFAPGQFIRLNANDAVFNDDYGVDGEPVRWATRDPFTTLTFNLLVTSQSNGILSNLLNLDILTHTALYPIMVEGAGGTYLAAQAWVSRQPDIVYGVDSEQRSWTLRVLHLVYNTQGTGEVEATNI